VGGSSVLPQAQQGRLGAIVVDSLTQFRPSRLCLTELLILLFSACERIS
jgi:hypothetical protein